MYYEPQILLSCLVWMNAFEYSVAKEPLDPELLRKFTKDVETVLSPTLIEELQGAQSNRSAINAVQTVQRRQEPSGIIDNRKPEIRFDSNVYPYHYERSYHYHYPPSPQDGSSGPVTYSENFYEPRFRPRSQPIDNRDPSYYRSELYNPFDSSSTTDVNPYTDSDVHGNSDSNDRQRDENFAAGNQGIQISNSHVPDQIIDGGSTAAPPASFAPSHPNPFPDRDYDGYKHGSFGGPMGTSNHFRPGGDSTQHQNDPHSRYLPQGEGRFSESFHRRPVESYRNFPPLEFHGYNNHRIHSPDSALHRSQYLPPTFLGPIFPPGYQNRFQNNYQPSEPFNALFSENFTREFPSRPSLAGFYPSHDNYLPPSTPTPSITPAHPASNSGDPVSPGDSTSQPIPTTKPAEEAPVPLASNFNYMTKLFFPAKDDVNYNLQTNSPRKFSSKISK